MSDTTNDFSGYPAQRGIGRRKADKQRVNWSAVAVSVTIALWLLGGVSGWFGANAKEVKEISARLATLETQRAQDVRQGEIDRQGFINRMDRIEDKIDRIFERVK